MGADQTLVNAAFREARSRGGASGDIPGVIDRSSEYQSSIDINRQYLGLITGAMKGLNDKMEKQRLGAESQLKNFNNISKNNLKKLYEQKEPLPDKIIFAIEARIKELQADFDKVNTYGKKDTSENEKARIKIEASLQRVINQAIDTRAGFMKISGNMKNLNVDQMSRNTDSIAPMETVLDLESMDANNNITVKVIDGNLTFITKDFNMIGGVASGKDGLSGDAGAVGMTMSQLQSYLPTKNAPHEIMLNDSYKTAITNGKNGGVDGVFNVEAAKGEILGHGSIADTQDFQSAMDQKHPQLGLSFTRSLTSNAEIPLSIIQHAFPNQVDPDYPDDRDMDMVSDMQWAGMMMDDERYGGDEDGVLEQSEIDAAKNSDNPYYYNLFMKDAEALIDVITNVDNPLFSESTSKDLYAGWVANTNKTVYDDGITKNVATQQKVFDKAEEERLANLPPPPPPTGITGKVKVGMTRVGGGVKEIEVPVEQVDAKYNKVINASKAGGDVIVEGWEGGRTYRYLYKEDLDKWQYQIFDSELQRFRTYGGVDKDNETDKDGELITDVKTKLLTTEEVLGGSHLNINARNSNLGKSKYVPGEIYEAKGIKYKWNGTEMIPQ